VFAERLRNEQRFPSLDALKEQLGNDAIHAKRALGIL
jgi:FAD synthase